MKNLILSTLLTLGLCGTSYAGGLFSADYGMPLAGHPYAGSTHTTAYPGVIAAPVSHDAYHGHDFDGGCGCDQGDCGNGHCGHKWFGKKHCGRGLHALWDGYCNKGCGCKKRCGWHGTKAKFHQGCCKLKARCKSLFHHGCGRTSDCGCEPKCRKKWHLSFDWLKCHKGRCDSGCDDCAAGEPADYDVEEQEFQPTPVETDRPEEIRTPPQTDPAPKPTSARAGSVRFGGLPLFGAPRLVRIEG
jgi:hypothetical protein